MIKEKLIINLGRYSVWQIKREIGPDKRYYGIYDNDNTIVLALLDKETVIEEAEEFEKNK